MNFEHLLNSCSVSHRESLVSFLLASIFSHRQILRTSYISHESYERFCTELIGSIIHERTEESEDEGVERPCYRAAHVVGFHLVHPLRVGVHKLHYLDEAGGTADVVLAVRDYKIGDMRKEVVEAPTVPQGFGGVEGDGDEGNERVHSVMVTYPHEAVPMDLFIDSVMGSVLQVCQPSMFFVPLSLPRHVKLLP